MANNPLSETVDLGCFSLTKWTHDSHVLFSIVGFPTAKFLTDYEFREQDFSKLHPFINEQNASLHVHNVLSRY